MKSTRIIFLVSMLFSLLVMGGVMYGMLFGPDKMEFEGKSFRELLQGGELLGVIVVPVVMLVTLAILWGVMRSVAPVAIKNGVIAPARVLEVRDTGVSINDNPQVALPLEVTPRDRAAFQAEVKTVVSRLNAALVQPGIDADVVFDPNNLKRIQVRELKLGSAPQTDAESRLKELNRLYDQGLITGEEFRAKREEILNGL